MTKARYFLAGSFIDGTGSSVRRKVVLEFTDSVITAIRAPEEINLPTDTSLIDDFSCCTIVPPLVDCSIMLTQSPTVEPTVQLTAGMEKSADKISLLNRHIGYCQTHGVIAVADNEDISDMQNQLRQDSMVEIRSPGPDFIKINYSSSIDGHATCNPVLDLENMRHILLHKVEKKAVVVANGQKNVAEAIEAGCDAIEQGFDMGHDNLGKMAVKNILWIPSVLRAKNGLDSASGGGDVCCRFSTRYVAPGKSIPGEELSWKRKLDNQLSQLRLARELGVKTAIGTGAGTAGILHGEAMVEEMKLFIKAGYSLEEVIQCASENGAVFFDMKNCGPLRVGSKASFLITRGTPGQLPRKLSYLQGIYINGNPSSVYHK